MYRIERTSRLLILAFLFSSHCAYAQSANSIPKLRLTIEAYSDEVPSWLVWRAFHTSITPQWALEPEALTTIFHRRLGLTESEIFALARLGTNYLDRLSRIDEFARYEVNRARAEIQSDHNLLHSRYAEEVVVDGAAYMRVDLSQAIHARLAENGVKASVEEQRLEALNAHTAEVGQMLGWRRLAELDRFIAAEVASKAVTITPPPIEFQRVLPSIGESGGER